MDLDQTYQAALDRLENDEIGMRTLKWVTYAKRYLEATELQHALAVEPTSRDVDEDDLYEISDLISKCAGLVTFDSERGIFRLVHYTTQTFLQNRLKADGNAEIAQTCLRYLSFPGFSNFFRDKDSIDSCLEKYKLGNYAVGYWFEHVNGNSEEEFHSRILETFGTQETRDCVFHIMECYMFFYSDGQPSISLLLWASMCGLLSLCRKILDKSPDIKLRYVPLWSQPTHN